MQPDGGRFHGGDTCGLLGKVGFEARRFGQRNREHRAQPVNHIGAEQQRNLQARFFHRRPLCTQPPGYADAVEQGANAAGADFLEQFLGLPAIGFGIDARI